MQEGRDEVYKEALGGNIIFPTVFINGQEVDDIPVPINNTILQIALNPKVRKYALEHGLPSDYFMRISNVHIDQVRKKSSNGNASVNAQINSSGKIELVLSKEYQIRPSWFKSIKTANPNIL